MGGSVVGTGGGAAKTGGYFQLSVAGSVSKISAYIRGYGLAKAAIYSDLNGGPGSLVGGVTGRCLFLRLLVGLILFILVRCLCRLGVIGLRSFMIRVVTGSIVVAV